ACWMPVAITADALLAEDGQEQGRGSAAAAPLPPLEEVLLGSWPLPFGWLVIAQPVAAGQLRGLASEAPLNQLMAQRNDSPRSQLTTRRAAGRHTELRRAPATGLWDVWLLAGGDSPDAAAQIAGLLCASADLDGLPYALAPRGGCGALEQVLG